MIVRVREMARRLCKGIVVFEDQIEEVEDMNIRDDDIWVCTFPRSGTTMTQEMVYLIETLDFETACSVQLDERCPILEVKDDRYPYYRGVRYIDQLKSPRMIKTHLHHCLLPDQLQKGKGRIIYMVRNPKDVVTSFYRLMQWEGFKMLDVYVNSFVDGTGYACPWPRHVLEYWERRNDKHVLFLKYEDVVRDKPSAIRRIAKFLGRTLTDKDVCMIHEHCKVENMRNNDKVNMSYWRDIKYVNDSAEGAFINKGQPGAWRDVLTTEHSVKIDALIHEVNACGIQIEDT